MAKPATENSFIKKPHQINSYTPEQITEFSKCADPVTGPLYFLENFYWIQHPTKGRIQYVPFDFQRRLIQTLHNNKQVCVLWSRQVGKTTTVAGYLLWLAMFIPDSVILVAAHKYLGASEIMSRVRYAYESVPDFIRAGVVDYNKGTIIFENGSKISAQTTTENTGKGTSISVLYLDELAAVKPGIARAMWSSILPTLSTGGKCFVTSTPNTETDLFAELWQGATNTFDEFGNETDIGRNGFKGDLVTWKDHPERDEKWEASQRAKMSESEFEREHNCRFISFSETLINNLTLAKLQGIEPIETQGQVRWYKKPERDKIYLVSLDPSMGTGGDPASIEVFESPSLIQVAEWRHNNTPIERQVKILSDITQYLSDIVTNQNQIYYTTENNTLGEAVLVAIRNCGEENIRGTFLSEPARTGNVKRYRKGYNTTNTSKLTACSTLKRLVESSKIVINSKALISELRSFVAAGNTFKAMLGETDDLVTATLVITRMISTLQEYMPDLNDRMNDDFDDDESGPMPFIFMSY